jgi:hypothetical protein
MTCLLSNADGRVVNLKGWYKNQAAFLLLSGPSLASFPLTRLAEPGVVTFGVNNSWAVWKPRYWVSVDSPSSFVDVYWKDPSIVKLVPFGHQDKFLSFKDSHGYFQQSAFKPRLISSVLYFKGSTTFNHRTWLDEEIVTWGHTGDRKTKAPDSLGDYGGRSVMLAALKLMYWLGFRRVFLLGCDFQMAEGDQIKNYAFDQWRHPGSVKGNNQTYHLLEKRFEAMRSRFRNAKFEVFNCNAQSGLRAFPFRDFETCMDEVTRIPSQRVDTEGWYNPRLSKARDEPRRKPSPA